MSGTRTVRDMHKEHLASIYFSRTARESARCPALVLLRDETESACLANRIRSRSLEAGGMFLGARPAPGNSLTLDDGTAWTGRLAPAIDRVLAHPSCSIVVAESCRSGMAGDATIWAFDALPSSVETVYRDLKRLAARGELRLPALLASSSDPRWLRKLARDLEGAVRSYLGYKVTVWTDEDALAGWVVSLAGRVAQRKNPADRRTRIATLLDACHE